MEISGLGACEFWIDGDVAVETSLIEYTAVEQPLAIDVGVGDVEWGSNHGDPDEVARLHDGVGDCECAARRFYHGRTAGRRGQSAAVYGDCGSGEHLWGKRIAGIAVQQAAHDVSWRTHDENAATGLV